MLLGTILIILSIWCLLCCWCKQQQRDLYEKLTPEEDLTLVMEDTYESTSPKSTLKKGVVKKTE
jgi:hypothetical protein